ncbi:MAG TPA: methylenetetrahydrofolate reductase [Armatimonadota bacterium]|nr:methylenetetrahydrofolate reductase [Armatimonadota bacterium]
MSSHLQRVLESGAFVLTAEIGPPMSADAEVVRRHVAAMRGSVDAINLTDNQTAMVRMSSIAAATIVQAEGVEAVVQMTVRDRNRIGLQSDLLGLAALGIRNVVCMSGDHPCNGNHAMAKPVYDLDSLTWLQTASRMTVDGLFFNGDPIKVPPALFVGAVENPFAPPYDYRPVRMQKKADAGARFIQTQCTFDVARLRAFMARAGDLGLFDRVKVMVGITPLKSVKMAERMYGDVPGVALPDALLRRMQGAADAEAEGIAIALETIEQVRAIPGVAGIHLMPVFWEKVVPVIAERAGLLPRPQAAAEAPAVSE